MHSGITLTSRQRICFRHYRTLRRTESDTRPPPLSNRPPPTRNRASQLLRLLKRETDHWRIAGKNPRQNRKAGHSERFRELVSSIGWIPWVSANPITFSNNLPSLSKLLNVIDLSGDVARASHFNIDQVCSLVCFDVLGLALGE